MLAGLSKHVGEKIGCAVDHEMLFGEIRDRGDEAVELDQPLDPAKITTQSSLGLRKYVDRAEFRGALTTCHIDVLAQMAGNCNLSTFDRQLSRKIKEIAADDVWHVVR